MNHSMIEITMVNKMPKLKTVPRINPSVSPLPQPIMQCMVALRARFFSSILNHAS